MLAALQMKKSRWQDKSTRQGQVELGEKPNGACSSDVKSTEVGFEIRRCQGVTGDFETTSRHARTEELRDVRHDARKSTLVLVAKHRSFLGAFSKVLLRLPPLSCPIQI